MWTSTSNTTASSYKQATRNRLTHTTQNKWGIFDVGLKYIKKYIKQVQWFTVVKDHKCRLLNWGVQHCWIVPNDAKCLHLTCHVIFLSGVVLSLMASQCKLSVIRGSDYCFCVLLFHLLLDKCNPTGRCVEMFRDGLRKRWGKTVIFHVAFCCMKTCLKRKLFWVCCCCRCCFCRNNLQLN